MFGVCLILIGLGIIIFLSWYFDKKVIIDFYLSLKIGDEFLLYKDHENPFSEPIKIITILDKKDNYIKYREVNECTGQFQVKSENASIFFGYLFILNHFRKKFPDKD